MIRFGCLGAARITPKALIEPVKSHSQFEVIAIAARSAERARIFADEHGADLTIKALEAGKPILCEKPMAMNAQEAARMAEVAEHTGVLLVEAFHYRFHPAFAQVMEIVRGGDLGRLQTYEGHFTVEIPESDGELRHELALGGGAMMDLGCYPLHWARSLLSNEPEIVSAEAVIGRPGIDLSMRAEMIFDGGVKASITTSMAPGAKRNAEFKITGCDAMLHFENPIAPHLGYRITLHPLNADEPIVVAEEVQSQETTYHHQLAHFLDCLSGEAEPLLPPSDGVANMVAIDAIYKAAGLKPRGMPD